MPLIPACSLYLSQNKEPQLQFLSLVLIKKMRSSAFTSYFRAPHSHVKSSKKLFLNGIIFFSLMIKTCLKSMPTAVQQSTLSINTYLSLGSSTRKFTEMLIFQHCLACQLKNQYISWYQYKPVRRNQCKPSKLVPSNHKTCNILLFVKLNWLPKSE